MKDKSTATRHESHMYIAICSYLVHSSCSTHVAVQPKGLRIPRNNSSRAIRQREKYTLY